MMHCVTVEELCKQSGLTLTALSQLEEMGLLRPTYPNPPRYRPRLVGWAWKVAFLLEQGWTSDEIAAWAKGRWSRANPRQWPPDRHDWQPQGRVVTPRTGW